MAACCDRVGLQELQTSKGESKGASAAQQSWVHSVVGVLMIAVDAIQLAALSVVGTDVQWSSHEQIPTGFLKPFIFQFPNASTNSHLRLGICAAAIFVGSTLCALVVPYVVLQYLLAVPHLLLLLYLTCPTFYSCYTLAARHLC